MAKVVYTPGISGWIGRVATGVYYRASGTKFGYLRGYTLPTPTTNTEMKGSYLKNLKDLWNNDVQSAYKDELKLYAALYKNLPVYGDDTKVRTNSTFAIWYGCLYAWQKSDPTHVDLASVNAEDVATLGTNILTIAAAVNNGFMLKVDGSGDWTAEMVEVA